MARFNMGDRVQATGTVVGFDGLDDDIDNVEVLWDILDGSDTNPKSLQWGHDPAGLRKIPPTEPPNGSVVELNNRVLIRGGDGKWFNPLTAQPSTTWDAIGVHAKILFVKELG